MTIYRDAVHRWSPRSRRMAVTACWILLVVVILVRHPAAAGPTTLYDSTQGDTPDTQGMEYGATDALFQSPPVAAAQTYADGLAELRTNTDLGDHAGYTADAPLVPVLDRTLGFTLTFQVQLVDEQHTSPDRAGFSVIVLAQDKRGIELGFWPDRVWAQSDSPLFTHAEEAPVDTTIMTAYALSVIGETYTLQGGGVTLSGRVRDYQASPFPSYGMANFIFLGDNTTHGGGLVRIASVAVTSASPAPPATSTMTTTAASPSPTSTMTTTGTPLSPTSTMTSTAVATAARTSTPSAVPHPAATTTATASDTRYVVLLPLLTLP